MKGATSRGFIELGSVYRTGTPLMSRGAVPPAKPHRRVCEPAFHTGETHDHEAKKMKTEYHSLRRIAIENCRDVRRARAGYLLARAGVARGRRRMILLRGRAEQLLEDRLQRVGPDLICLRRGMKFVRIHHAVEQLSVFIGELIVDA